MFFDWRFVPIDLSSGGEGDVVGDDGVELGDPGVGQVPLVGQDHVVGAHADPALLLLGRELLLGQLPGLGVGQDPLVVRFDRADGVLDLEIDLVLLVLEVEHGLPQVEPGLGQGGPREDVGQGQAQGQAQVPVGVL